MKKYLLPILIALSALSISAAAAFYSVTGLAKLFVKRWCFDNPTSYL